jgi:hypothetical protein
LVKFWKHLVFSIIYILIIMSHIVLNQWPSNLKVCGLFSASSSIFGRHTSEYAISKSLNNMLFNQFLLLYLGRSLVFGEIKFNLFVMLYLNLEICQLWIFIEKSSSWIEPAKQSCTWIICSLWISCLSLHDFPIITWMDLIDWNLVDKASQYFRHLLCIKSKKKGNP